MSQMLQPFRQKSRSILSPPTFSFVLHLNYTNYSFSFDFKIKEQIHYFFCLCLVYRNFLQQSFKFFYLLIWERERKGERERNLDLLFHSFMHLLVDSCRCPDWGSNLQTWLIGMMLSPTRLPVQGLFNSFNPRNIEFTSLIYVYLSWVYSFSCKIFLSFNVLPLF